MHITTGFPRGVNECSRGSGIAAWAPAAGRPLPARALSQRLEQAVTHNLKGKTALVTGGSRGIGAAVVRRLARDGAAVAINYRAEADAAEGIAAEITEAGGAAVAVQGDVSAPEDVRRVVDESAGRRHLHVG